ncbi:MAG: hypothetical protein KAI17_00905 [Thiotrichaceae bacterium]|nr:hypothetical protein [Thiotrichaceae bacterium]
MFLRKVTDKVILASLLVLSSTSYAGFTVNKLWTVPATQQCDAWGTVSVGEHAVGVLSLNQSMKITIPVPEGAVSVDVKSKSHASEPSIVYTLNNYNAVCYSVDASLCPSDQIPVVPNGLGADSLAPKVGANTQRIMTINAEDSNVFVYQVSLGVPVNKGESSMTTAVATFTLTDEACAKRAGVEVPQDGADQQNVELQNFANVDVQDGFAPVILTPELKLHLNQMSVDGHTYAADLQLLKVEEVQDILDKTAAGNDDAPFIADGKIFFSMDLSEVYPVDGINEDHDEDGVTIAEGDCNDNDPLTHPDAEDAAKDCSTIVTE